MVVALETLSLPFILAGRQNVPTWKRIRIRDRVCLRFGTLRIRNKVFISSTMYGLGRQILSRSSN